MKKLILIAISLLSVSSFGKSKVCDQSWAQIDANFRLQTEMPKVQFGTVFVSVDSLCVNGENLETKQAVGVCSKWGGGEASACQIETPQILSTPIAYAKDISAGETGFETITGSIPLSYSIPVGTSNEAGLSVLCKKTLAIPHCQ